MPSLGFWIVQVVLLDVPINAGTRQVPKRPRARGGALIGPVFANRFDCVRCVHEGAVASSATAACAIRFAAWLRALQAEAFLAFVALTARWARTMPVVQQTAREDHWQATPRPGSEMASSRGESAAAAASRWGNGASIPDAVLLLQVLSRRALRRERVDAPALPQEAGEAEAEAKGVPCESSRETDHTGSQTPYYSPSWTPRLPEGPPNSLRAYAPPSPSPAAALLFSARPLACCVFLCSVVRRALQPWLKYSRRRPPPRLLAAVSLLKPVTSASSHTALHRKASQAAESVAPPNNNKRTQPHSKSFRITNLLPFSPLAGTRPHLVHQGSAREVCFATSIPSRFAHVPGPSVCRLPPCLTHRSPHHQP
ncbi:hypothetical protein BCR34DRAFT_200954 [Clohesyomyces aquaticus]|uniref:Ig-like domain-containing protein n=1 Tax=Clohesyomyces aquaticus TaxID=1231657 RepID=A0A1Y1ZX77_9PLEO|nr:hypothetical protein BCR34DRAFT_200954 [Clohesyomyces aquaticus]